MEIRSFHCWYYKRNHIVEFHSFHCWYYKRNHNMEILCFDFSYYTSLKVIALLLVLMWKCHRNCTTLPVHQGIAGGSVKENTNFKRNHIMEIRSFHCWYYKRNHIVEFHSFHCWYYKRNHNMEILCFDFSYYTSLKVIALLLVLMWKCHRNSLNVT